MLKSGRSTSSSSKRPITKRTSRIAKSKSNRRFTTTPKAASTGTKHSFNAPKSTPILNLLTGKSNSLYIPLDQPFPIPPGCEPTGPVAASVPSSEPINTDAPTTSTPISTTTPPTSDHPTPLAPPKPLAKSHSRILRSYRQAVFGKGTVVSVAQTDKSIPMSALTMSVDLGSRYETPAISGLTHFLSQTFLRSTTNRVTSVLHRDMQKLGVKLTAESNRDHFIITATTPDERITPVIGTFFDLALHSAFDLIDLQHDLHDYTWLLEHNIKTNNFTQFQDILHAAAFGSATLGLPLYPDESLMYQITPKLLKGWSKQFFTSNRISFNAVNVDHQSFMSVMESRAHKLPGSTMGNYKVPRTAYVAKESHITARALVEHGRGVDFGSGAHAWEDYTGSPMDYVQLSTDAEQHVGVAYLAPHASHVDTAATHVIKSMLATGMIYGEEHHPDFRAGISSNSILTTQRSHKTPNSFQSHILTNPLKPQYHQQWDLTDGVNESGSGGAVGRWNPMVQYRNANGFSPHLKSFDANYHSYSDSGLLLLHSVLPTTSVHARRENIGFMQLGMESLTSSTVATDALIEHHKQRVMSSMSRHFTSNLQNVSQALAIHSTQLSFTKRAELVKKGLNSNGVAPAELKWTGLGDNTTARELFASSSTSSSPSQDSAPTPDLQNDPYHDPIDQLYRQVADLSPQEVRKVIEKIVASPPTLISYSAPTSHIM